MKIRHVLLFCICLLLPLRSLAKRSSCSGICGKAKESPKAPPAEGSAPKAPEEDERIVNGWDAPARPFLALIRAVDPKSRDSYETCGGAVLNRRFVATAAHCVCMSSSAIGEESLVDCEGSEIKYDAAKVIEVFVGLNTQDINMAIERNRDLHQRQVEKVIVHPGWSGSGVDFPDLSLIKLKDDLDFSDAVSPVCLGAPGLKLDGRDGYVAGWGLVKNMDCLTDDEGPERHTKCRFPFKYNGLDVKHCLKTETPSSTNAKCKQFEETMKGNGLEVGIARGDSVVIVYGKRPNVSKTICYSQHQGPHGWCGTCIKNAQHGEYGYCPGGGFEPPEEPDLITVAKSTKHWGYCSHLCESSMDRAKVLQETRLSLLPDDTCRLLNTSMLGYRSDVEFCAGNKVQFPTTTVYRRYLVQGEDKAYTYKKIKTLLNPLDAKKEHLNLGFYLGQTDSCQGDSGGPIYVFIDGRAHMVGVVSRGGECAGFNQPGIYTNLVHAKWNSWVRDAIAEGDC